MDTKENNPLQVTVDAKALREILMSLTGPGHLVRELQAITDLPGYDCPIKLLIKQFNEQVSGDLE